MKRALLAMLCFVLIAAIPASALGSAAAILSQLKSIERRTRTTRSLDEAEREKYRARVRDLTQRFSDLPMRDPKHTAEFGRLSASIWRNLREQALDPRMRGLPAPPTPRDKEFARRLRAIQDRCRNLPKPVSDFGLLGKTKAEVLCRLRDEVVRFAREYRQAVHQYRADVALVRRYKPESQSGFYKLNSTRELLEGLALKRLQEALGESREVLASRATRWLDDAKSELQRKRRTKPGESAPSRFEVPAEGLDPVLQEMFPEWKPGDPHPLDLPPLPENDVDSERPPSKAEQIVEKMRRTRLAKLDAEVNETLESVWNLARLGAALERHIGGDPANWERMINEVQEIARDCDFKPADLLTKTARPAAPSSEAAHVRRPTNRP